MTRDEILAMEAGRELDALVAEAMGWIWLRFKPAHDEDAEFVRKPYGPDTWEASLEHKRANGDEPLAHLWDCDLPHYSTDIAAAWEVVEYMGPIPFSLRFQPADAWRTGDGEVYCHAHWTCWFEGSVWAEAPTAPLAICRAALLAAMEMEG